MTGQTNQPPRVLSGMRPTGHLHVGHYYGVLKHWVQLQNTSECLYFVADWHALTTNFANPIEISESCNNLVIEWIACGLDPNQCTLFVQSWVKEHSELLLLLSMITPISWLERVPSYKDYKEQSEKTLDKSLLTLGFLSYPLLQTADILLYKANYVPVGDDQVAHIEFAREIARRFNFLYGGGEELMEKVEDILPRLPNEMRNILLECRRRYCEQGDLSALQEVRDYINEESNLTVNDKDRLHGYVQGSGQKILVEPEASVMKQAKFLGSDGKKMSKSLNNTLAIGSTEGEATEYFLQMPTDPARIRRNDPGDPNKCPVWIYHKAVSSEDTQNELYEACKTAKIGCVDCKKKVITSINKELYPIRENIIELTERKDTVRDIVKQGSETARKIASETIEQVRDTLQLPQ